MGNLLLVAIGGALICYGGLKLSGLKRFDQHAEEMRLWHKGHGLPFDSEADRPRFEAHQEQIVFNSRIAIVAGILCIVGVALV